MVEKLEVVLLLLGAVGVLAVVAARIRFPFPILLVVAGLGIGFLPGLPSFQLDPDLIFMIFLPPLLFSAAWSFPWDEFRANLVPIFALAVGLVIATAACVAFALTWLVPGMTLAVGFVLGAIISPPDAVAATAVLKNVRIPRRLGTILEGESMVNDSSGLVAYQFAVAAVVSGAFSLPGAAEDFVWLSCGGILFGWLVGIVAARIHESLDDPAVELTLTILTPYLAYLPAERLGFSGVLAVVAAGLHVGHRSWETMSPESRINRDAIWRFLDYLLNGLVFILIGLQFPLMLGEIDHIPWWMLVVAAFAIWAVTVVVRVVWILALSALQRRVFSRLGRSDPPLSGGALIVGGWAGMRGVVSIAAALALPLTTDDGSPFPFLHLIQFLTFAVVFATLVFQGLSLPWLARWLDVEERGGDYQSEASARLVLTEGMIEDLDTFIAASTDARERELLELWRDSYVARLRHMKVRLSGPTDMREHTADGERKVFPRLFANARERVAALRAEGKISEQVWRRLTFDYDLEEQRIQRLFRRRV